MTLTEALKLIKECTTTAPTKFSALASYVAGMRDLVTGPARSLNGRSLRSEPVTVVQLWEEGERFSGVDHGTVVIKAGDMWCEALEKKVKRVVEAKGGK